MTGTSKAIDRNDPKSAAEFNEIACNVFAPIYPVIARQTLDRCAVREGICVDLGCGPGLLAIAMAKITAMNFFALDYSPPMLAFAAKHIGKAGLAGRILPVVGDVHRLPFPDGSIDIMISRGSMLFWNDKPAAFREIGRVLKKNGKSYIGCGMGSTELKDEIFEKMRQQDKHWGRGFQDRQTKPVPDELKNALNAAGVRKYDITSGDAGLWIYIES